MALEPTRLPDETLAQFYARLASDNIARECNVCHAIRLPSLVQCPCNEYAFTWISCPAPLDEIEGLFSSENSGVEGVEQLSSDPAVNPELFAFTPIEPEPEPEPQLAVEEEERNESDALPQQPEQTEQVRHESGPTPSADAPSPDASRDAAKGRKRKN